MPSANYDLFLRAMREKRPIHCRFDGFSREICPIVLGHTDGRETALAFQFAGETSKGPLQKPQWRCFELARVTDARLHDGSWRAGDSHRSAQSCVREVDYDVNPLSPYSPRHRL